ncbi:MAG: ribonuclease P protein component [Proteobacteria bacterium]|nr:ribonuclease P protein component [Pseudomonadota bacterium]
MSKLQSMPARRDFLQARNQGQKALARGLVIQATNRDSDIWRVGLTASKKIGNAVCRNRARSRMRALARQHLAPLARPGVDYVLIARHDTVSCDWQDLVTGLTKAIRYLHHKLPDQDPVSS